MDLREYREDVFVSLKELDDADKNWSWYISEITEDKIDVRWGYIDYIGQWKNFSICYNKENGTEWLSCDMGTDAITDNPVILIGNDRWDDAKTVDNGIRKMIRAIGRCANAVY